MPNRSPIRQVALLSIATLLVPVTTWANLGADLTLTSDYVFRGVSQSDNKPALQGNIYWQDEDTGGYVSLFGSTLDRDTPNGDANFEIDLSAGIQGLFPVEAFGIDFFGPDWLGWDAAARYYFFPDSDAEQGRDDFDFWEVSVGLSYHFDYFSGWSRISYTPDLFGNLEDGRYYAGGINIALPLDLTGSAHLGFQDVSAKSQGEHDTLDWSLSVTKNLKQDLSITAAYTDTDARDSRRCFYGRDACDARLLISITKRW